MPDPEEEVEGDHLPQCLGLPGARLILDIVMEQEVVMRDQEGETINKPKERPNMLKKKKLGRKNTEELRGRNAVL